MTYDQLPADLIVHVAVQLCSGFCLARMECTCGPWRAALRDPKWEEMLWKQVTLARFARIEMISTEEGKLMRLRIEGVGLECARRP